MASRKLLVDVHTHVYLPRYASVLRSRTSVPRIMSRTTPEGKTEERLLILDHEPSGGRPVGAQVSPPLRLVEYAGLMVVKLTRCYAGVLVLGSRGKDQVHG
jgi:hypothetical protein